MLKAQRLAYIIVAFLLLGLVVDAISQNWPSATVLHLLEWNFHSLSMGSIFMCVAVISGIGVFCLIQEQIIRVNSKQRKVHRDLERQDVSRETAEEKVKVLEQKIETLERALKKSLKK